MTLDLAAIKARAEAALSGDWRRSDAKIVVDDKLVLRGICRDADGLLVAYVPTGLTTSEDTRAFIAAARQDVPALVERVEQQAKEIERLRWALEEIAEARDAGRYDGKPEPYPVRGDIEMWLIARAALEQTHG